MRMLARPSSARPRPCAPASTRFVAETGADELMVVSDVYDHAARLRSFELIAAAHEAGAELQQCAEA